MSSSSDPPPPPDPEPDERERDPLPEPETETQFVEMDPTGRYGRYREVLGKGAFKKVYKAFDELEGIEVAWNKVKVADVLRNTDDMDRLYSEVHLLKTLKHKNIIKLYNSWVDSKKDNVNFITEVFTSGTLRQYRKKHQHVDIRAVKNWSRQILSGLLYLHGHEPPVIHRDLKCDNIFVNGNQGEVKIGDLGLAAILNHHSAHSVIGTPEFMAPELYEEDYNELVDIYAFGMCLLELVTFEYPYSECSNPAQIFWKVTSGVKPAALNKVSDPDVKQFIEKCIATASERLSAGDLLRDPFLQLDSGNESVEHSSYSNMNHPGNVGFSEVITGNLYDTEPCVNGLDFTVEGQRKDINTIFLKLSIADSTGQFRNIHFPFDIEADTSISVATEMVGELDLTDQDVTAIAEMIDAEIQAHVPEWVRAFEDDDGNEASVQENYNAEADNQVSSLRNESGISSSGLVLEQLSSGRKYWSDSPRGTSIDSPSRLTHSNFSSDLNSHGADDHNQSGASSSYQRESNHIRSVTCKHDGKDGFSDNTLSKSGPKPLKGLSHYVNRSDDNLEAIASPGSLTTALVDHNQSGASCSYQTDSNHIRSVTCKHDGKDGFSDNTLSKSDPEPFKGLSNKLGRLLVEQQKERDCLRKKHDMAISDIIKELPPELCRTTLSLFGLKYLDFITQSEQEEHARHSQN